MTDRRLKDVSNPLKNLRIYSFIDRGLNTLTTDFSIVGLKKKSPKYEKGRKTEAEYLDNQGNLVVKKTFSDVITNGELTGLRVLFEWYGTSNQVLLSKTEVVKEYNKYEAATELRKRRQRQIDYLVGGAKGTGVEPYVSAIFVHYKELVQEYIEVGDNAWLNAINNETDITINSYLSIIVLPETGGTVKDSILGQIT